MTLYLKLAYSFSLLEIHATRLKLKAAWATEASCTSSSFLEAVRSHLLSPLSVLDSLGWALRLLLASSMQGFSPGFFLKCLSSLSRPPVLLFSTLPFPGRAREWSLLDTHCSFRLPQSSWPKGTVAQLMPWRRNLSIFSQTTCLPPGRTGTQPWPLHSSFSVSPLKSGTFLQ